MAVFAGTRPGGTGRRTTRAHAAATAIPLALITGWPYWLSILVMGVFTVVYTYVGGIRAVVWVDVVQMGVYLLGAAAALAVALAVYVTNDTLAGTTAAAYGFQVTATGVEALERYAVKAALPNTLGFGFGLIEAKRIEPTRVLPGRARQAG